MRCVLPCFVILAIVCPAAAFAGESRFQLLSTRCEPEAKDGPEATPQSPPLEVDDPETPGCNRWEINLVADGDFTGSGKNLELPFVNSVSTDSNLSAIGESRVGVKYLFLENEEADLGVATYPQITFVQTNSRAVDQGLATPGAVVTLPLLMAVRLGHTSQGDIKLTANLGMNLSTKDDVANYLSAAVGIGSGLTRNLSVMAELTTQQAFTRLGEDPREQLVKADLGMMASVSRKFLLFGAVGHSLYAADAVDHSYGLVGFRLLAGGTTESTQVAAR